MNGLRLLITEECQYNCFYCHRKEGICSLEELTAERLLALCSALAGTGFSRAEITGGEPLLYPGTADLVRALKEQCGFSEVYLTTNGVLLSQYAKALKDAGTDGVNIHVDTMAAEDFSKSTGREQMLMARLASLESPSIGTPQTLATNQSRETRQVKLPSWMRLKR